MEQGTVVIRRIAPEDAAQLRAFYAELSPESRVARFMAACRGISTQQARTFATAADRGAQGFIAIEPETRQIVGHLCLETVRPGVEEIAVATADRIRGRGIARELVKAAAASGRQRKIHTFVATALSGNRPIHRLLQRAGIPWRRRQLDSSTELLVLDVAAAGA